VVKLDLNLCRGFIQRPVTFEYSFSVSKEHSEPAIAAAFRESKLAETSCGESPTPEAYFPGILALGSSVKKEAIPKS
jgi:hypothetical protein